MIKTIINADDFGMNPEVNEAISYCFEKRIITNTTLMVNMPYADEAVSMAKEKGFSERVGLHLNLTAGKPLTEEIRKMKLFCDEKGCFHAGFHLSTASRLHISKKEREAVAIEAEAQIRKYLAYGLPEKHLDSHHHAHTDFSVWKAVMPLVQKYGFRSVRISRNMYEKTSFFNSIYKKVYNNGIRKMKVKTADYFGSYTDYELFFGRLDDNATVEIMLHPLISREGILMDGKTPMEQVSKALAEKNTLAQTY